MDCVYKIYITDDFKEKRPEYQRKFDYCYSSLCKVLEFTEEEKKKEKKVEELKNDSSDSKEYTKYKFKFMRMCAPSEIQIREMLDDILNYYKKYFAFNDNDEKIHTIEITVNCHKYDKFEFAHTQGSCISIWYFSILNSLFSQAKELYKVKELNDVVCSVWRDSTKDIFINEIRYVMAHEMFHALTWELIKSEPLEEMAAEYFALSYINDFCNATGQSQTHLFLRGRYSEEDKEKGEFQGLNADISKFKRNDDKNVLLDGDTDYYGGTMMLAYALMTKKMYKENPYYVKIFEAVQESDYQSILKELVEFRDKLIGVK